MKKQLIAVSLSSIILSACGGGNTTTENTHQPTVVQSQPQRHFEISVENKDTESKGKCGDKFTLTISNDGTVNADSAVIIVDGKKYATLSSSENSIEIDTKNVRCGKVSVTVQIFTKDNQPEYQSKTIVLYSDVIPGHKSYKILKTYNHDVEAYTQGLLYDNGFLYESTGLNGRSSLRKVQLERGDVLQSIPLESEYFGEGLALTNDNRLVQLTWRSHKGFVYDKETFARIDEFAVATEGWGLTAINGDTLALTDGTENIYFIDSKSFTVIGIVQVYDNLTAVDMLNETELVNGHLLSNIYHSDLVAEIDYHTGKVLNYIDLGGLLPDALRTPETDVLNGIAYDNKGDRLFVTGKKWPKLYMIKIIN